MNRTFTARRFSIQWLALAVGAAALGWGSNAAAESKKWAEAVRLTGFKAQE